MRIVQIIDSLEAGGSERMALNYANALSKKHEFSGLIATRQEGILRNQINEKVSYLFLKRRKSIDLNAVLKLRKYILANKVDFIHAHSSSFFIAFIVKLTSPRLKIIWHDHYGLSQDLLSRKSFALKFCSLFFSGIISVNTNLKNWAISYLWCTNVIYLPNFIDVSPQEDEEIKLKGTDGNRIVCVANLRPQKNHLLLLEVAVSIKNKFPDWTFHLFGKDFEDDYSREIKNKIADLKLQENVFFYGTAPTISQVLKKADIGILTSLSEGLPLALLEYGMHKLPVVATNVGEISKVVSSEKEGIIVDSHSADQFVNALGKLINDSNCRKKMGQIFYERIQSNYSAETIMAKYIFWLNSLSIFASSKLPLN